MLPDLESLRCFVEAARLLNFRAAARAVGLTPAALGQRIRQLEDQMAVQLFHRTTRKVELTEAGMALLPTAQTTLDMARSCVRAARGDLGPIAMDITVGTRHELGLSWLTPMLPALAEAHPGVTFHLYFGSGPDLELRVRSREIDCAITSSRIADPKLDSARVLAESYAFVATPALLAKLPFNELSDASKHTLIDTSREIPLFRYWRDASGTDSLEFDTLRCMGTVSAIHQLIARSEGVGVLPTYLIRDDLESGRLVRIMPHTEPKDDFFRLVFRADDARRPLLRAVAATMSMHPLQ